VVALSGPAVAVDAEASITEVAGRLRLVLHVKNGQSVGERILEGDSCADLAESAAVILAMSGTAATLGAPSPVPLPPPPLTARPAEPPQRVALAPAASWFRASAVAAFDAGTLPAPAYGGGIALAALPGPRLALGLAGAVWAGDQGTAPNLSPQGAMFNLVTGDASGCYAVVRGAFELSPCALVELAWVSATGVNVPTHRTKTGDADWFSVGFGARLRWEPTGHFAIALDVDGIIPIPPYTEFVIKGGPTVYTTGSVAVRSYLGPEVRF
jgi:hypothetical protein